MSIGGRTGSSQARTSKPWDRARPEVLPGAVSPRGQVTDPAVGRLLGQRVERASRRSGCGCRRRRGGHPDEARGRPRRRPDPGPRGGRSARVITTTTASRHGDTS
jgi:hypothetical protein